MQEELRADAPDGKKIGAPKKSKDNSFFQTDVTIDDIARMFDYSNQAIDSIISKGFIKRNKDGIITLEEACRGIRRYKESEVENAKARWGDNALRLARVKEIELRIAEKMRELVTYAEAHESMLFVVGSIVSRLNGLPAQITRDIDERARIESIIDRLREEVAEIVARRCQYLKSGLDDTLAERGEALSAGGKDADTAEESES